MGVEELLAMLSRLLEVGTVVAIALVGLTRPLRWEKRGNAPGIIELDKLVDLVLLWVVGVAGLQLAWGLFGQINDLYVIIGAGLALGAVTCMKWRPWQVHEYMISDAFARLVWIAAAGLLSLLTYLLWSPWL